MLVCSEWRSQFSFSSPSAAAAFAASGLLIIRDWTELVGHVFESPILGRLRRYYSTVLCNGVKTTRASAFESCRDGSHLGGRVAQEEQLRPSLPPALLHGSSARPLYDLDVLHMRRVHEELHLDARALYHVSHHERRVRTPSSHRHEHAREHARYMLERDAQHRPRQESLRVSP